MNIGTQLPQMGLRGIVAQVWQGAHEMVMHMRTSVVAALAHSDSSAVDRTVRDAQSDRAALYDAQVLRHAVYANSPHEVDWLLCAAIISNAAKRRYCLERALAINPDSQQAKHTLATLSTAINGMPC